MPPMRLRRTCVCFSSGRGGVTVSAERVLVLAILIVLLLILLGYLL